MYRSPLLFRCVNGGLVPRSSRPKKTAWLGDPSGPTREGTHDIDRSRIAACAEEQLR